MKKELGKSLTLLLVCTTLLFLCACTNSQITVAGNTSGLCAELAGRTEETPDQGSKMRDAEAAKKCLLSIMLATDAESMKAFLTPDSYDAAANLAAYYDGEDYDLTVEKAGIYDIYHLFFYTAEDTASQSIECGIVAFVKEDGCYKACVNPDVLQEISQAILCKTCGGEGELHRQTSSVACSICGGTGQQYIPNAYYDGFMWQGLWQACGGCGGAGWIPTYSRETCTSCNGLGIIIN